MMGNMESNSGAMTDSRTDEAEERASRQPEQPVRSEDVSPEMRAALDKLELAKDRFINAAIAFCEGSISAGQLRAARELLRERETKLTKLKGQEPVPFVEEAPKPPAPQAPEVVTTVGPLEGASPDEIAPDEKASPELADKIVQLDQKIARLEKEYQQGIINNAQYRAIRKHYLEQREVAMRFSETFPESTRWRAVLEEGKTTYLMQLHEATCMGIGFYEVKERERIYAEGHIPHAAEASMALLGTFGKGDDDFSSGRVFATQTDDGLALLLVPGRFTLCLAVFSQAPPTWQVGALREVHRNFEAANQTMLKRGVTRNLVYPDLTRFIKS
jgi:hypothetical protein